MTVDSKATTGRFSAKASATLGVAWLTPAVYRGGGPELQ